MKIIIIGDGKVGYSLAENLSKENHDVTIIDKNSDALKRPRKTWMLCVLKETVSAPKYFWKPMWRIAIC